MWWRRLRWAALWALVAAVVIVLGSVIWTRVASAGHVYDAKDAPAVDTIVVLGTQVAANRTDPLPMLRNRLEIATRLFAEGKGRQVLVTGDAGGASGNETEVMTAYLIAHGVPADRILADPLGFDTYESCTRIRSQFKLNRVVLVTQNTHIYRAVAICRSVGVDADGALAPCADCDDLRVIWNNIRDPLAAPKAVAEVILGSDGM